MVHHPQKREKLFGLHHYHIDFDEQRDEDALRDLRKNLPSELAGELLWRYLRSPGTSHLHLLASQELEPSTLVYLRKAFRKLVKDIEWCQEHPGIVPSEIAPNPRHAPKDVKRAREIEELVQRLLSDPSLSDCELAGLPVKLASRYKREMAAEARRLVELRQGEEIKRYSQPLGNYTIGRKPRRPTSRP